MRRGIAPKCRPRNMTRALFTLHLQKAVELDQLPKSVDFRTWIQVALTVAQVHRPCEVLIRLVDEEESQGLNRDYREKDKPTNVLSFPADLPDEVVSSLPRVPLGDIIICAPVVFAEAKEQGKLYMAHWAHMTIHGVLHLLGYDHIEDDEAEDMEALEIQALAMLGYANPYETAGV